MSTHARRVLDYYRYLQQQSIKFGFADEIADLCAREGNDAPPQAKWAAQIPAVRVLERMREKFGPTTLNSSYRSPAYNKGVGGARSSRHVANDADDFRCATGTPKEWAAYARELRDAGVFKGGIGTYRTFVHVDTRGTNADWAG